MKLNHFLAILCSGLLLTACSRSKDPQFYVLNPVFSASTQSNQYNNIRLGIDEVMLPDYLDKPQLTLYCTAHQSTIDENHQWAEELSSNIKRVIRTNLSTFLPGALVDLSPWDVKFKPNYQLQIDISQFNVDIQGRSVLQAEYVFYKENQAFKKYKGSYLEKIKEVTPANMVISMNNNLTKLTRDIAKHMPRS